MEKAATAAGEGSRRIAELQDSMLPIEAGDAELRAALAETRELVDRVGTPARQFLRRSAASGARDGAAPGDRGGRAAAH